MSVLLLLVCFQALEKTEEQSGMDNRETQATLGTMYRTKEKQRKKLTHTRTSQKRNKKMCNTDVQHEPHQQLIMNPVAHGGYAVNVLYNIFSCYSLKFCR